DRPHQFADRWHHREGRRHSRLQRDADRSEGRQADPRGCRNCGRQAPSRVAPYRNEDRLMAEARLKTKYNAEIRPALIERFGFSTPMQAPKILKVTVNMGVGDAKQDSKMLEQAQE